MTHIFRSFIICFLIMCDTCLAYADPTNSDQISEEALLELQQKIENLQKQIIEEKQIANRNDIGSFSTYSSKVVDNNETNPLDVYILKNNTIDIAKNISANDGILNLSEKSLERVFDSGGGINVGNAPPITSQGEVAFIGAYSGNNTLPIGMISSTLFATTVLGQRNNFDDYSIFLGGFIGVTGQTWYGNDIPRVDFDNKKIADFSGTGQNIYLTSATLYFLANVGDYVTAAYDVGTSETENFFINNAFVMFGNITVSPFFVTAGRSRLTVASYGGGGPYTGSIASFLSVGRATNVSLNYKSETTNISVAVFGTDDQKANFSAGFFYGDALTEDLSLGFNTGYVYNLNGAENFNISVVAPDAKIGVYNIDANIGYNIGPGLFQVNSGWATTTDKYQYSDKGSSVLAGAWYVATNYSLVLGGRNTNFGFSYGETYNATNIPMGISASPFKDGLSQYGIQKQFIFSAQRAYVDNNVLFGPEWAYQEFYNGVHMNTITLDMSVYI